MQQTSLAQAFLVRLCCSSSVATYQGLQARILARVLPSSVVVLSILSAVFPSCLFCIDYTSPKRGANTCRKTDGKRAFYGLSLLMLSTRAAPFAFRLRRCQGSFLRFAAPIMARCHPSATLTRTKWRGKPQKGQEGFRRHCPALQGPCLASLPASRRSQGKRSLHRIQCHTTQETMPPQRFARSH